MKIVVGGSMKFRQEIMDVVDGLNKIGIDAVCPNTSREESSEDKAKTTEKKMKLALDHYHAIDGADAVYFICPGGYFGTSCKLELGYALALKKKIYFSEETNDLALDCYVKKFIPLDELKKFKEEV